MFYKQGLGVTVLLFNFGLAGGKFFLKVIDLLFKVFSIISLFSNSFISLNFFIESVYLRAEFINLSLISYISNYIIYILIIL